jgi:hypothetical protein
MAPPQLIYCADRNRTFARAAVEAGWLYGARLPAPVYERVDFADQDWKDPDLARYLAAIRRHRPATATVLDWERDEQWPDVLAWAEAVAPFVGRIVVIPKVSGRVREVPEAIGGRPVVLGFSVPTSYGGTPCGVWEFGDRPVHLLGGSPHRQRELARYLNVVSADGNMIAQQARKGRFWSRTRNHKGHWWQLRDAGDHRAEGVPLACFRRSLAIVKDYWDAR